MARSRSNRRRASGGVREPSNTQADYIAAPDDDHLVSSANAMEQVVDIVSGARSGDARLSIVVHHVINTFVSPQVFVFTLPSTEELTEGAEPFIDRSDIHVFMVANHPIERQTQAILGFFGQFIERQRIATSGRRNVSDLPDQMSAADTLGEAEAMDQFRYGWRATAEMLSLKADQLSLGLRVRYEPAFATDTRSLDRRSEFLARIYNEMEDFRDVVDRIVAAIAGRESRVAGGSESVRLFMQQRTALGSTMNYFAQAARDGLVFGNGFVTFTDSEPLGPYNLRPSQTDPVGDGRAVDRDTGRVFEPVVHFTGFEQPSTSVGLGLAELLTRSLHQRAVALRAIEGMQPFAATRPEAAEALEQYQLIAAQQELERAAFVSDALAWWAARVPEAGTDLYFENQDLL